MDPVRNPVGLSAPVGPFAGAMRPLRGATGAFPVGERLVVSGPPGRRLCAVLAPLRLNKKWARKFRRRRLLPKIALAGGSARSRGTDKVDVPAMLAAPQAPGAGGKHCAPPCVGLARVHRCVRRAALASWSLAGLCAALLGRTVIY